MGESEQGQKAVGWISGMPINMTSGCWGVRGPGAGGMVARPNSSNFNGMRRDLRGGDLWFAQGLLASSPPAQMG